MCFTLRLHTSAAPTQGGLTQALEGIAGNTMARDLKSVSLLAQDQETDAFLTEFQTESDRAAAVLGPAMLDDMLKNLIQASLSSENLGERLLGQMRPLGTFSSRISIAEAIGLISPEEARDLDRLRGIRNEFAHGLNGIDFENQSVKDRCQQFISVRKVLALEENNVFAKHYPDNPRSRFNLAVALSMVHISNRLAQARRFQCPDDPL